MGDRVAVLNDGVLQQCAPPRELYRHPANVFVAGFIGSPAMNLFALRVIDGSVSLGDCVIPVRREIAGEVVVGVRPEHLQPSNSGLEIEVRLVEELGADTYCTVGSPVATTPHRNPLPSGCRAPIPLGAAAGCACDPMGGICTSSTPTAAASTSYVAPSGHRSQGC